MTTFLGVSIGLLPVALVLVGVAFAARRRTRIAVACCVTAVVAYAVIVALARIWE